MCFLTTMCFKVKFLELTFDNFRTKLGKMAESSFQKRKRSHPEKCLSDDSLDENPQGVLLRRFAHQVAGRSPMYCFDNETVCKPLNEREAEFYNSRGFPKRLQPFTPRYHGSTVAVFNGSDIFAVDQSGAAEAPVDQSESSSSCSDQSEDDDVTNSEEEELSPWGAKIHQKRKKDLQQKIGKMSLRRCHRFILTKLADWAPDSKIGHRDGSDE